MKTMMMKRTVLATIGDDTWQFVNRKQNKHVNLTCEFKKRLELIYTSTL